MKVFISHSSHDKWVARQIATQLKERGHATFLDEKDIKTGDSIDDSIQKHLRASDDLLVLLSPASLESKWVFIEIGGAKALDKRIVPVLFHVAPNDVPQVITKHLARDINEIDRYYDELERREEGLPPKKAPKPTQKQKHARTHDGFAVGDRVRILDVSLLTQEDKDMMPKWRPVMDKYSGAETTITEIPFERFTDPSDQVKIAADNGDFMWATRWFRKVK